MQATSGRTTWTLLAAILGIALALRLPGALSMEMWTDEGATLGFARSEAASILGARNTLHPPGYPLLARAWLLVLTDAWAIRVPAVLGGVVWVLVVFLALRALDAPRAGLFAALLTAASVYAVYYSQEARGYTCAVAASGLAHVLAIRHVRRPSPSVLAGALVAGLAAVSFHYQALAPVAALVGLLALHDTRGRESTFAVWVLFGALALAVAIALGPRVETLSHFVTDEARVRVRSTPAFVSEVVSRWSGGGWIAGVALIALAAVGLVVAWKRSRGAAAILTSWATVPFAAVAALPSQKFFEMRYLMVAMPAAFVLGVLGLAALAQSGRLSLRAAALSAAAALALVQLPPLLEHVARPEKQFPVFRASAFGLRHISFHSSLQPWIVAPRGRTDFVGSVERVGPLLCLVPDIEGDSTWKVRLERDRYDRFFPVPGVIPEGETLACVRFDSVQQYERIELRFYVPSDPLDADRLPELLAGTPFGVRIQECISRGGETTDLRVYFLRESGRRIGLQQLSWHCDALGLRVDVTVTSPRVGHARDYLARFARRLVCHRFEGFGGAHQTGATFFEASARR
jgi:hypothetical protein